MIRYSCCDLVFTRSDGILGRGIRWATRTKGEEKTEANHVGLITWPGSKMNAFITEALWTVKNHSLFDKYHKNGEVAVYRPRNLTLTQSLKILDYMSENVGRRYGWWKILFHLGYKLTGWRKLLKPMFIDERPICSYLVARAFSKAGLNFGVAARSANPDDMMDFCRDNPDKYELVHPMQEI